MALSAIGTICENYLFGSVSCVCPQWLSCVQLFATLWTAACQAPLSMGFSRQDYWSELPFPSAGDLPDLGIKPMAPALAGRFVYLFIYLFITTEPPGKPSIKKAEM